MQENFDKKSLSSIEISGVLGPYLQENAAIPETLFEQLSIYLELLLRWNSRTNLTAIRQPSEIVRRHFGESIFAAQHLGNCKTLLDFGSGAGFPGLPIQLFRPDVKVTLAEAQNKKATFLREVVRTLNLPTEIWAGRVESMPEARRFDVVTLRAVDDMDAAVEEAAKRASDRLALLTTVRNVGLQVAGFTLGTSIPVPDSAEQILLTLTRIF